VLSHFLRLSWCSKLDVHAFGELFYISPVWRMTGFWKHMRQPSKGVIGD